MFVFLVLINFKLFILINSQRSEIGEVVFVNVLFRHGDRSPIDLYPSDPYKNASLWPDGFGELSNIGKSQQYELGQWLRKRYDSLLKEEYSPDIIYVQSTDIDRTLMSAECNLAGMFPPKGAQVWTTHLDWQPIPVHTIPRNLDNLLAQQAPCPAYTEELRRIFTTDEEIKQLNETYSKLFRWMSEYSGENITFANADYVRDTLYIESLRNLSLPEWTKSVYPEPMQEASIYSFMMETWNTKLARLKTGSLLGDMIKNMENKIHNNSTRNVHVYSAHDENIVNLLNALGAFNYMFPPYASCLMLELRVDSSGTYYVTLFYRNSTVNEPYIMTVEGCEPVCPLDKFISLSRPLIPENWEKECGLPETTHSHVLIVSVVVIAIIIIVLVLVVICYFCQTKKY